MNENDADGDVMSPLQHLITRVVATATVNRWSFAIDYAPGGEIDIRISIPADDREDS